MPSSQNYWQEIDGKYLINYRVAALATPLAIISPALQEHRTSTSAMTFFDWIVASSTGWAIAAAIYALADITIFRKKDGKQYPLWVFIAFGATLGFIKGFFTSFTAFFMQGFSGVRLVDLYFRTFNGLLVGMTTLPITAFLLKAIYEYTTERNRLISDYIFLEEKVSNDDSVYEEMQSSLSEKVDKNLTKILIEAQSKIQEGSSVEVQWQKIATTLRDTAQNAIRPLSHEIWKARRKELKLSSYEFLRFAFQNMKFRPALVLPLYFITTFAALRHENHIWHPTFTLILKGMLVWVLLEIAQIFLDLLRGRMKYSFEFILVGIAMIHYPVVELIYKSTDYNDSPLDLIDTFWLIALILITGIVDSALRTQIYQIKTLRGLVDEKRLELIAKGRDVDRLSRDMAKYLHGTIQSKLMAAAMAVELAGRKNDKRQLDIEIDRALQSLKMPSKDYLANSAINSLSDVNEIANKWDGIVQVSLIGIEALDASEVEMRQIADVLNEALLNAYRHGGASKAIVKANRMPNRKIELLIEDNGEGIKTLKPGLGSSLYSSISSNWLISNLEGGKGAVLKIEF